MSLFAFSSLSYIVNLVECLPFDLIAARLSLPLLLRILWPKSALLDLSNFADAIRTACLLSTLNLPLYRVLWSKVLGNIVHWVL